MKRKIFFLTLALILLSCLPTAQAPTSPPGDDTQPTDPSQTDGTQPTAPPDSIDPPPGATDAPPTQGIPEAALSPSGPWMVFSTEAGMWAVNPDGSGLTLLNSIPNSKYHYLNEGLSPGRDQLAYISATGDGFYELTLNVLSLPDGGLFSTPLISPELEPTPGDPLRPAEAVVAIGGEQTMAWSPDGSALAFMGAMDGPSSDLYIYTPADGQITRLTSGPAEGINPSWSPDGKYILHFGVNSTGSGAGYSMAGVWAAQTNGDVTTLYDPSGSGGEMLVGWLDNTTFVVHSWNASCGPHDLRAYNIATKDSRMIYENCFTHVAMDPEATSMVMLIDDYAADYSPGGEMGVYFIGPGGAQPYRILDDDPKYLVWLPDAGPSGMFFTKTEFGIQAVSPTGEWIQLDSPIDRVPLAATGDGQLLWVGNFGDPDGMWVGDMLGGLDNPPRQIYTESVVNASWCPDGQHILFFTDDGFYIAYGSDYTILLIADGLVSRDAVWIIP